MALFREIKILFPLKYWLVTLAGMLFSFFVWKISTLEFRYMLAICGGLAVFSLGMILIKRIESFLIYAMVFNIPFATFGKWLFVQRIAVTAKGVNLGLAELLIILAYLVWFCQIFIARSAPLPKLHRVDYLILLLIIAQFISLTMAPNKVLGLFDIIYNIKYALMYFFIAHKVKYQHLKWIVAMFLFAIIVESSLAFYEHTTGNVSIGLAKGNIEAEEFGQQAEVPGLQKARAAGTTNDSHTLGLYYTMLLPIPFVLLSAPVVRGRFKFLLVAVLGLGIGGLIITFSRAGWLSFVLSMTVAVGIMVFLWKQKKIIPIALALLLAASLLYPSGYKNVFERLFNAPHEILEARYDTYWTALDIWRQNPLFGYGPGNYIDALNDPDIRSQTAKGQNEIDIPVHNAFLWIAADLGLFGVIAFFGIILLAIVQCFKLLKCNDYLIRGLTLAILTALLGYLLDGLTDPMFRETVPYTQLWVYIALVVSFVRLLEEQYRIVTLPDNRF